MANTLPPKYGVIKGLQSTLFDVIERIGDGPEYAVILQGYSSEAAAIEVADRLERGEAHVPYRTMDEITEMWGA